MAIGRRRGPATIAEAVDFGTAELVPDTDRPGCWTLLLDREPQSYVDTTAPARLCFEYMRRLASIIDAAAPAGAPLRVLHLGGGAMTLPRYVAATRPGSTQLVVEHDAALVGLVRRVIPLPRGASVRVRVADARQIADAGGSTRYPVMIVDMPQPPATPQLARLLAPGGLLGMNLIDGPGLRMARARAAELRAALGQVCVMAEPGVLRGRRDGNVVLAASSGRLPLERLTVAAARDPLPVRLMRGSEMDRFLGVRRSFA